MFLALLTIITLLCFISFRENVLCSGFFGSIVKGITGIGSSLFGGIKSGKERKKAAKALKEAQEQINQERAFNDTLFNREYYQDFLQRSENQAALRMLRERLKRENQATAQRAVITGATPESMAKAKELSNNTYSDTVSRIAANSSNAKENVMNRYLNFRNNLNKQLQNVYGQKMNLHNQNATQWSNLMQNGLNSLTESFAEADNGFLSSLFKK